MRVRQGRITPASLKSVPLFADLPDEDLAALAGSLSLKRVPRGKFVINAGENTAGLYVVLSGRAKALIADDEGREVTLGTIGPGELFGEMSMLDGRPRSATIKTLETCDLLRLSEADFNDWLARDRTLPLKVLQSMVARLRSANRQIESLALMDVFGRVARLLLELAENIDGQRVIRKAPTKQEIAHMIGASREMVSRVMRELQSSGYISVKKRQVTIFEKMPLRHPRPSAGRVAPADGAPRMLASADVGKY